MKLKTQAELREQKNIDSNVRFRNPEQYILTTK